MVKYSFYRLKKTCCPMNPRLH